MVKATEKWEGSSGELEKTKGKLYKEKKSLVIKNSLIDQLIEITTESANLQLGLTDCCATGLA